MDILITCKAGYEKILAREISLYHFRSQTQGHGWALAQEKDPASSQPSAMPLPDLCFACHILEDPLNVRAASVNSFVEKLTDLFIGHIRQRQITGPWPFLFTASGDERLTAHAGTAQERWLEKLSKKMSRVAKLAKEGLPHGEKFNEGFFVHVTDFNQAFVAFRAFSRGQQRMKMDPLAPSRSYLKIEEAFHIFGREPREGETVVDLGAAPGGWSHSALKRGASVTAVDNGPLKGAVASHSRLRHLKEDALKYRYEGAGPVDWLFCDVLEKPDLILKVLHTWLSQRWCRCFVVNLKVGRLDPITVLKEVRDPGKGLLRYCKVLHTRQLYHDREEITLMGETK